MKNLTWQNPEQLFVAQELINKVKSKCCGIKDNLNVDVPILCPKTEELLNEVMNIYGEHSADYLEKLTHRENPWKETRGDLPEYARSDKEITLNLMKEYYSSINK